jgi:hypothetical protein
MSSIHLISIIISAGILTLNTFIAKESVLHDFQKHAICCKPVAKL